MSIRSMDGKHLVGLHRSGDCDAFATIVRAHYRPLVRRAARRIGDGHAAEDAVQDALLRAYRALPRFGGHGEWYLTAWLYRILDNVCNDEINRRRRADEAVSRLGAQRDEPAPSPEASLYVPDPVFAGAVAALPPQYRDALVMRDVDGLSYAELADAEGISEDNARARVSRARSALRRLVAPTVAAYAWVLGVTRRGGRMGGVGGSGGSSVASAASASPASSVVFNMPVATDLVASVTTMTPPAAMSNAARVAAAVVAIALPVGGVAASNHGSEQRRDAASAIAAEPRADARIATTGRPGALTDEDVPLAPAAADAEFAAAADDDDDASRHETAALAGSTTTTVPPDAEASDDASDAGEGGDVADEQPASSAEATAPAAEDQTVEKASSAEERVVVIAPAEVGRRTLDDGRLELTATFQVEGRNGPMPGRMTLVAELPENGCKSACEISGSIRLSGDETVRIRLVGEMVSHADDADDAESTYTFTGRYTANDAGEVNLPPRGKFSASFGSSGSDLVVSLSGR